MMAVSTVLSMTKRNLCSHSSPLLGSLHTLCLMIIQHFFQILSIQNHHYISIQATAYQSPSTRYSIAKLPLNTIPLTYGNQEHIILLSYDSYYIASYRFRDNQFSIIFVVQNNIFYIVILPTSLIKIP